MTTLHEQVLEQELEAPDAVLILLHDTALQLGASAEQARETARTGVIDLESRSISVAFSVDEGALVLSAPLPGSWFNDPANRRRALMASTSLMLQSGVAFCRPFGEIASGAALICRWPLDTGNAARLAAWITEFAAMANMTCRLIEQEAA